MRYIRKGREPEAWENFRIEKAALRNKKQKRLRDFDDAPTEAKEALREALLREQGWLCCYCMTRIEASTTKIEHRQSQASEEDKQLDYENLLAACMGGERPREDRPAGTKANAYEHCDKHKGDRKISLNPTSIAIEERINYQFASGRIEAVNKCAICLREPFRDNSLGNVPSVEPCEHCDLHIRLNLNLRMLQDNRAKVLNDFQAAFEKKHKGDWSAEVLRRELQKWSSPD